MARKPKGEIGKILDAVLRGERLPDEDEELSPESLAYLKQISRAMDEEFRRIGSPIIVTLKDAETGEVFECEVHRDQ